MITRHRIKDFKSQLHHNRLITPRLENITIVITSRTTVFPVFDLLKMIIEYRWDSWAVNARDIISKFLFEHSILKI